MLRSQDGRVYAWEELRAFYVLWLTVWSSLISVCFLNLRWGLLATTGKAWKGNVVVLYYSILFLDFIVNLGVVLFFIYHFIVLLLATWQLGILCSWSAKGTYLHQEANRGRCSGTCLYGLLCYVGAVCNL